MKKLLVALATALFAASTFAAGLTAPHTAFPTPDATADFGLFYSVENLVTDVNTNMLSYQLLNNNTSTTINIPASTGYTIFTGTQTASAITINLPSATTAVDGQELEIMTVAAASGGITLASSGATISSPTISWTSAGAYVRLKYFASTTTWYAISY